MISKDRGALICDLAETYQIYDMKRFPCSYIAILASGLGEDSRIKRKLSGAKIPLNTMLLAAILDRVNDLCWMQTKDGQKGRKRPKSVLLMFTGEESTGKTMSFSSGADFMEFRKKAMEGGK